MRKGVAIGMCLLYLAGVLVGVSLVGPTVSPWFVAAGSTAFVWCYLAFARGRPLAALSIVVALTIVGPITALIAVVWPIYRSFSAVIASLWLEYREHGPLGGVALFAPLAASAICAFIARRFGRLPNTLRGTWTELSVRWRTR